MPITSRESTDNAQDDHSTATPAVNLFDEFIASRVPGLLPFLPSHFPSELHQPLVEQITHTVPSPIRAADPADDPRILMFGHLLVAANQLECLPGRSLEGTVGLDHSLFELLLVVGRAGGAGVPVRDVAQERVLTSGGATRLVQRAVALGLVERMGSPDDRRVQLIGLTAKGERVLLEVIKTLSKSAASALRALP